jgi:FHA domain
MTLALEINDAGVVLARDGTILAEEPGVAMLDGASPETGEAAVLRARLKPLYAESRYWQDLGTEALARAVPAASNRAEIAYAQLERLVAPHLGDGREVIIAVPPWYTREQLGLLLGVAKESGLEPVGLVDAGLASSSLEPAPETMLHLELGLHRAVVTVLDCAAGLRRTRFEVLPQHGWLALQQAWLDAIAAAFVLKTRFDPLHQAATEQLLSDGLPAWLASAASGGTASIELASGSASYSVAMSGDDFAGAATHSYDEYARVLQRARPTAGPLNLRLSSRFAAFPGLEARLAGIRDCDIARLPRGAAALGALAWESNIRRDRGALTLVQQLPVALRGGVTPGGSRSRSSVPTDARPTHLVLASRAWRLDARPLTLGAGVPEDRRAVALEPGPGVSRVHCSISLADGSAWLEDHSTYGTFLNGERIGGRVELRAGDRLRVGSPGVECELVRVVDDDGAT